MTTQTDKKVSGPATQFRPKDHPAQSVTLTKLAKEILDAAAQRTGESKSDVVEGLLRKYGATFEFDTL